MSWAEEQQQAGQPQALLLDLRRQAQLKMAKGGGQGGQVAVSRSSAQGQLLRMGGVGGINQSQMEASTSQFPVDGIPASGRHNTPNGINGSASSSADASVWPAGLP